MQQVFGMCSTLLQRNSDTRRRKLNIRRYKVSTQGRPPVVGWWVKFALICNLLKTLTKILSYFSEPWNSSHIHYQSNNWTHSMI